VAREGGEGGLLGGRRRRVREAKAAQWTAAAREIGEGVLVDGDAWLFVSRCRSGPRCCVGEERRAAHGGRRRLADGVEVRDRGWRG
jgi:hypothetical protein